MTKARKSLNNGYKANRHRNTADVYNHSAEVAPVVATGYRNHDSKEVSNERMREAALQYAGRGKPVFPCKSAPDKSPLTSNGHYDATTDRAEVERMWRRYPGASIGIPASEKSEFWVLDVDRLEALGELADELPATLTVQTPSGGLHYYFRYDPRIGNGTGRLPEHVDVRGGGKGYVLVPPSPGYRWQTRAEIAEAPEWLVELIIGGAFREENRPRSPQGCPGADLKGPPILEGKRHNALASILGRAHDGSRDLTELTELAYRINEERCSPPIGSSGDGDLIADVDAIVRSIYAKPPCSPQRPPELLEMADVLSGQWYKLERSGIASKHEVAFLRMATSEGLRTGTTVEDGLRVSLSLRQAAERIGCHTNTIPAIRNRLVAKGLVRYDKSECAEASATGLGSGAFVLLASTRDARRECATPTNVVSAVSAASLQHSVEEGVTTASRPPVWELRARHYSHGGPVTISQEDTLCVVEAHAGSTATKLARVLGWSRPRDLEYRHLRPLERLGLLEERGGCWWVPDDYEERQTEAQRIAYSTVQARCCRSWSSKEAKWVFYVAETGCVASQEQRQMYARERHRFEREGYQRKLAEGREAAERDCNNAPELVVPDKEVVDAATGEVVAKSPSGTHGALESSDAREDECHPDDCGCTECFYEQLVEKEAG